MIQQAILLTLLATPAIVSPAPAAPVGRAVVPAVQEDDVVDKRPEVKELIDTLKGHAKKKAKEDEQAIATIDELVQEFERSGPKDKASIVSALQWCYGQKRPKEIAEGVPDTRLYDACSVALGAMGPESVKALIKLLDHKSLKKLLSSRGLVITSLGKTRHLDGVKPMMDLLKDKDEEIISYAAQGLGYHDGSPLEVRKDAFEALLKILMSAKGTMDSDPQDLIARERYYAIAASIITSLEALSGHNEREPEAWQRWWNKNKKNDWDEEA